MEEETKVAVLETKLQTHMDQDRLDMAEIRGSLAAINTKLTERPSWAVTFYLTLCTSAVVGLLSLMAGGVRI